MDSNRDEMSANRIYGIVLGTVTDNNDELGRVKLNFPWMDSNYESIWAPVATLMSGNDMGAFFLPEKGDEVIVAFDHGDLDHPYVIGSLWNNEAKPPESNSDRKNNIRKIKSRSGHEIILCDDNENKMEKVEIHSNAGHTILLDDSSGSEKIEIKDKTGENSIVIDSSENSIEISSLMKLSLKAKDITIESDGMMTISASANLNINGSIVKIN